MENSFQSILIKSGNKNKSINCYIKKIVELFKSYKNLEIKGYVW